MRIAFVHPTQLDYTPETPYARALGGSESAVAYLSAELARRGHAVTLLSNVSMPGDYRGVACRNMKTDLTVGLVDSCDVVVIVNQACGRTLHERCGGDRPLVLWTQHAPDQEAVAALASGRERKAWSGFAFVSEWQREQYLRSFLLRREACRVLRNAAAPSFRCMEPGTPWFETSEPPTLVYTSTAYRGLDILLAAWPAIATAVPEARLRVFAGASMTRGEGAGRIAESCRPGLSEGVEFCAPIGQTALAHELGQAAALAYPSTFAETSCVAAMEAMAAGAMVITTRLGALPETLGGFGHLVEFDPDARRLAHNFAAATIAALRESLARPEEAAQRRSERIAFARRTYDWSSRAREWEAWLADIAQ